MVRVEKQELFWTVIIDRPGVRNAVDRETADQLTQAFADFDSDDEARVAVLYGEGGHFCAGADLKQVADGKPNQLSLDGDGPMGPTRMRLTKPVIAAISGYAIGGGNVLCTICDLTIASEKAVFGQVGPKVGSVDPGYGTALLARVVGEKKAREMWYLCRRYSAAEALAMGLVNVVVPHEQLDAKVQRWCDEIQGKSPTAIAIAKRSFNMDTAHQAGIAGMGMYALKLYYDTEESREGVRAFQEKRKPDFRSKQV